MFGPALDENVRDRAQAELGRAVRRRRRDLGLTQEELAALAGVARRSVSALETGNATIRLDRDLGLRRGMLLEFGERYGVRSRAVTPILDRMCDTVSEWVDRLDEVGLDDLDTEYLRSTILARRDEVGVTAGPPGHSR